MGGGGVGVGANSRLGAYSNKYGMYKSLVNQGIPGNSGKPGYSKNQENQT